MDTNKGIANTYFIFYFVNQCLVLLAIATRAVRLRLELPVSILLTCCGVTPILSATASCVMFLFILAIFILFPMALKSSSKVGTLLSSKVFSYIVTFVGMYYNSVTK